MSPLALWSSCCNVWRPVLIGWLSIFPRHALQVVGSNISRRVIRQQFKPGKEGSLNTGRFGRLWGKVWMGMRRAHELWSLRNGPRVVICGLIRCINALLLSLVLCTLQELIDMQLMGFSKSGFSDATVLTLPTFCVSKMILQRISAFTSLWRIVGIIACGWLLTFCMLMRRFNMMMKHEFRIEL